MYTLKCDYVHRGHAYRCTQGRCALVAHKCPCKKLLYPVRIRTYQWATPSDTQCHKHYGIVFSPLLK